MEAWREELYANELYHYGVKGMKWRFHKGATTKGVSTILGGASQVIGGVDRDGIGGSFLDRYRRYAQNRTRHQKGSKPIKSRQQAQSARNSRSGNRGGARVSAIKGSRTVAAGQRRATQIMGRKTFNFLDRKRQELGRKAYDGA